MSTISLQAGDVSWVDRITCDSCGTSVERHGTGEMRTARTRASGRFEVVDYEERAFDPGALEGWGIFETRRAKDLDERPKMDLCPHCAAVVQDWLLERVKDPHSNAPFGSHVSKEYGTVRAAEPDPPYEMPAALGSISADPRGRPPEPTLYPPAPPGPCIHRDGGGSTGICGRPAMAGLWYCFTHAARESQ